MPVGAARENLLIRAAQGGPIIVVGGGGENRIDSRLRRSPSGRLRKLRRPNRLAPICRYAVRCGDPPERQKPRFRGFDLEMVEVARLYSDVS